MAADQMECTVTIFTNHITSHPPHTRFTKYTRVHGYCALHAFNSVECFICVHTLKRYKTKPNGVQERACTTLIKSGHAPYIYPS